MQNPWSELPAQSPYVLATDIASIDKYNKLHNNDEKIVVESITVKAALPLISPAYDDGTDERVIRASWVAYFRKLNEPE